MDQIESDIAINPYRLKSWLNYIAFLESSDSYLRYKIYERALKVLPRSYKLWKAYLTDRDKNLRGRAVSDIGFTNLVEAFERGLAHLNKMPTIWHMYCELLWKLGRGTDTRRAFDRSLQALPITQHKGVWDLYIKWIREFGCAETAVRVYRRFLMYDPSHRETFVEYLESVGLYQEAVKQLTLCVDDSHYISPLGSSRHQLWMKLCDLCASHGDLVSTEINVEPIIKSGIQKFSDEVGKLWGRLADFYVQQGLFEKARDVFEEALEAIVTVKDFTLVFDKYVRVEERVLTAKLQWLEELEADVGDSGEDEETTKERVELQQEVDVRLARVEHLLSRRPLLLSSVVLRQNPHNVYEWLKRIKSIREQASNSSGSTGNPKRRDTSTGADEEEKVGDAMVRDLLANTYAEAVKTVDPALAVGKLSHLWIAFARFYERQNDIDSARSVFNRASKVEYKSVEELANVWCAWAEMEMRKGDYEAALSVLQKVVSDPPRKRLVPSSIEDKSTKAVITSEDASDAAKQRTPVSQQVYRNVKVWGLYLDLEEAVGTVDTCRAAYERAIDIKVATPQMLLNYATYLQEHQYFDDSFRVYEKAVPLFVWPQLRVIWLTYIDQFIERYAGTKIERLRDMFENAIAQVPEEFAPEFYIKYGKTEEDLGLSRQAVAVYERATRAVAAKDRFNMYRLYARKMEQYYGVTKTRPVYERAIAELSDDDSRAMCLEFSAMETKLGEVDRARAILQYGSQFAPPATEPTYWLRWREFEEAHGNEDTYREMLRVKRSIETAFSQVPLTMVQQQLTKNKREVEESGMVQFQPELKKQTL